jgi:ribose transport system permease protein
MIELLFLLVNWSNGLNIVGIEAFWQNVMTGFIIILAVYLDQLRRSHRAA